jgi:hypothetical protein
MLGRKDPPTLVSFSQWKSEGKGKEFQGSFSDNEMFEPSGAIEISRVG